MQKKKQVPYRGRDTNAAAARFAVGCLEGAIVQPLVSAGGAFCCNVPIV